MNKTNTAGELAGLLVQLGTKKNGSEHGLNYCFAYGTLTALLDQARFVNTQDIIDQNIFQVKKDLGLL